MVGEGGMTNYHISSNKENYIFGPKSLKVSHNVSKKCTFQRSSKKEQKV